MKTIQKGCLDLKTVKILQQALELKQDGKWGNETENAVRKFQEEHGLKVDGIVGDKTWKELGVENPRYINEIIIHCSATPEGKDYTTDDIKGWHIQRGFKDIGYHYVIYRDGTIKQGRKEDTTGAHCTNHNSSSIGICYIGGMDADNKKPKDTRTKEQKEALETLLKELRRKYKGAKIHSHKDFANKACPSFDATREYESL